MNLHPNYPGLAMTIHASNARAGWWSTMPRRFLPRRSTLATRNRGEIMMLIVSELSEADTGRDRNDDKLPHLRMYDVELADAAIRLFDLIGAEIALHGGMREFALFDKRIRRLTQDLQTSALMQIVNMVSAAMECHRKGKLPTYRIWLVEALAAVFALAENQNIALLDIIEEKRAFNAVRSDHKVENRMKADGKKY